jgi:tetratricopeptide (TPR) repeat protein
VRSPQRSARDDFEPRASRGPAAAGVQPGGPELAAPTDRSALRLRRGGGDASGRRDADAPEPTATKGRRSKPQAQADPPPAARRVRATPTVVGLRERDAERLRRASEAFAADRVEEARRVLGPLLTEHPDVPEVLELAGLCDYRMGRYRRAIDHLNELIRITGSTEQHPVLMDSHRALGDYRRVEELWDELGATSPGAALVVEGRIVAAGALADRGRAADAIRLLQRGPVDAKRPRDHHLRLWYALADLEERVGDLPAARAWFGRIAAHDPRFLDVGDRLRAVR